MMGFLDMVVIERHRLAQRGTLLIVVAIDLYTIFIVIIEPVNH